MSTEATGFAHVNLNDVDPQGAKVPLGVPVNFIVADASVRTYSNDNGSGSYVAMKFVVTDSPEFSGRTFYKSLFEDKEGGKNATKRQLRIVMDATGIQQTGQLDEWLADLVSQRATLAAPLEARPDKKTGKDRIEPNLFKAEPAI